ncbi:MAG: MgtC/SapB family protein, partial [Deferribacterales bacterium]|nr:MgtC/SapB family protein [Deferribacterales bacterium]
MNDIYQLLIAILSALLIGTEREFNLKSLPDEEHIAGIRTFALIGIIAALSGVLTLKVSVIFGFLGFVTAFAITIFSYLNSSKLPDKGLTTETSLIATYLSVYTISIGYIKIGVMSVVIIFALLSLKAKFRYFIDQLGEKDFYATLKFLILIAMIYPLLPDKYYFDIEILNPSSIFKIVILIAGLSYLGYIAVRIVGAKKGLLVSSILGS